MKQPRKKLPDLRSEKKADALSNITRLKGMVAKPAKPVSIEAMKRAIARAASHK